MIRAPGPDELQLYDDYAPELPARDYLLVAEQRVELPPPFQSPAPYRRSERLRVTGPHFALGPDDVYSRYPPAGSQGDYSATLPHVVLRRRSLPWEIAIADIEPGDRRPPWIALLLLTPDEWLADESSLSGTRTVPLVEYLRPPAGYLGPSVSDDLVAELLRDHPGLHVVVIDVAIDAFTAVAPALDELPFLAHVRQVDIDGQALAESPGASGWFSVVMGNRLPGGDPDGVHAAHLVSLEGFAGYLPGQGWQPPSGIVAVRLLALSSWSFNSRQGRDTFAELMRRLDDDVLRMPAAQLLPDPRTPVEHDVRKALDEGYTGLAYETRLGESTTGWYRGPCLPLRMKPNPHGYQVVEGALIYAAEAGMFDLSFAVAWQTGRLLALADRPFAAALLAWVRAHHRRMHLAVERRAMAERWSALHLPTELEALLAPDLLRRATLGLMARLARRIAPAGTVAPPLLGERCDPSGVRGLRARLPGLISDEELERLLADPRDPARALIDRVRRGR